MMKDLGMTGILRHLEFFLLMHQ